MVQIEYAISKDEAVVPTSWFETQCLSCRSLTASPTLGLAALLTMTK